MFVFPFHIPMLKILIPKMMDLDEEPFRGNSKLPLEEV